MEEAPNFGVRMQSNRCILRLAELDKTLKQKTNKLEQLKYLLSEITEHQLYVDHCKHKIKMIEKTDEYEKKYSPRPLFPPDPPPPKNSTAKTPLLPVSGKTIKTFHEFLVHARRNELADKLKAVFKFEKGIPIRLMIEVLLSYDPPLIAVGTHEKTKLCNALKAYFNRDTGTRQSIFPSGFDISYYEDDLITTKAKIDFILRSI
jgi:hypothetical protein